MRLTAELKGHGGNTAGFVVPGEVVEELGGGRRPKVVVTAGDYTFRTSIARMGDVFLLGVSQERRAESGLGVGDTVDLDIVLDETPRVVEVPEDLAAELAGDPAAAAAWEGWSFTRRKEAARGLTEVKKPETRAARLAKVLAALSN